MRRSELVRVSSKGQIVLPKRYREGIGIHEGDFVSVHELGDGLLILEKVKPSALEPIVAGLRREAKRRKFTRKELEDAVRAARSQGEPDAS